MRISVIIPVYNGADYIKDTVRRILDSSYKDIEVVLVNDGSKDNSAQILDKLSDSDKRVVVYTQENSGIYAARKSGIEIATGDYICFCDQDDYVDLSMYEKMAYRSENGTVDLVICGTYKYIEGEKVPYDIIPEQNISSSEDKVELIKKIVFREFKGYISNDCMISTAIWKCMVKRSLIFENNIKFRRYVSFEDDFLFLLDVISCASTIQMFPDQLYGWLVNPKSESHTITRRYIDNYVSKYNMKRDDIINMLKRSGMQEKDIYMYRQLAYCNMCNEYIQNECGARQDKVTTDEVKKALYCEDYRELSKGAKYFRSVFFKKKFVMFLIRHNFTGVALAFQKFYFVFKNSRWVNVIWNKVCK